MSSQHIATESELASAIKVTFVKLQPGVKFFGTVTDSAGGTVVDLGGNEIHEVAEAIGKGQDRRVITTGGLRTASHSANHKVWIIQEKGN